MRLHALRPSCKPFLPVRSVGKGPFYRNAGRSIVRPCALLKPAEGYKITWKQTTDEVNIKVPVRNNVRGRDVDLEIHPHRLSLKVGGEPVLVGSLEDCGSVDLDGCFFVMESDKDGRYIALTLAKKEMGYESWSDLLTTDVPDLSITDKAYLDVQIGDGKTRRIVVGLYGNVVPRTVANFRDLCTGEGKDGVGDPLQYKGSPFHRIIPGFMAQGGDITEGDGTGGQSIYGASFEDENFKLKHDSAGVVAMANAGPNTNNSQFYITLAPQPHLDGKHVVFGKVEEGMAVLKLMEEVGTAEGQPTKEVKIVDCGVLKGEASPAQS